MAMMMVLVIVMVLSTVMVMVNVMGITQHSSGWGDPLACKAPFLTFSPHNAALERVYFATTSLLMAAMMMITLSLKMMMEIS